jgi:hypothetical protein
MGAQANPVTYLAANTPSIVKTGLSTVGLIAPAVALPALVGSALVSSLPQSIYKTAGQWAEQLLGPGGGAAYAKATDVYAAKQTTVPSSDLHSSLAGYNGGGADWSPLLIPTYDTSSLPAGTTTRSDYYSATQAGDATTQALATKLSSTPYLLGTIQPYKSYNEAVEVALEKQRETTTGNAQSYYGNELQKLIESNVGTSSEYHYQAAKSGVPVAANPYEYLGDLSVEFLKGEPTKSSEVFSPVSGELKSYLPTSGGLQEWAWNRAEGKNENVSYMPVLAYLASAEGLEGPYGALYGGTGAKSVNAGDVSQRLSAWSGLPRSASVTSIMPTQIGAVEPTTVQKSSVGELGTIGGLYVVPGSISILGGGSGLAAIPGSYKLETTTTKSEPSVSNFLSNLGSNLLAEVGIGNKGTAGFGSTTTKESYDINLPSPYVSNAPSGYKSTPLTYTISSETTTPESSVYDTIQKDISNMIPSLSPETQMSMGKKSDIISQLSDASLGVYSEIQQHPLDLTKLAAESYLTGAALGIGENLLEVGVTKAAESSIPYIAKIGEYSSAPLISSIGNIAKIGVGTAILGESALNIYNQPTAFAKGEELTKTATMFGGFGLGYGSITPLKTESYYKGEGILSKSATDIFPYKLSIGKATIVPSSGEGLPTSEYTTLGISKTSGSMGQIERVSTIFGGIKSSPEKGTSLFIGSPKVVAEDFSFVPDAYGNIPTFAAKTPLETHMVSSLSGVESPKIELGLDVRAITSGSKLELHEVTPAVRDVVDTYKIPNSNKVANNIVNVLKDYKARLYGSSVQRGVGVETGIPSLGRPANDLDIMLPSGSKGELQSVNFANEVTESINHAAGKKVATVDINGNLATVKIGNSKLFDIHNENPSPEELIAQGANIFSPVSTEYTGLGMKIEPSVMTTEGVPVISYSEQVGRKLVGTVEYTPEIRSVIGKEYAGSDIIPSEISGKLAPRFEGRVKDIADYYYGERANIETLKKSGSAATRNKATVAETKLESWLNTWGKETAKNVRSSYESQISGGEPISINFGNYENVPSFKISDVVKFVNYPSLGVYPQLDLTNKNEIGRVSEYRKSNLYLDGEEKNIKSALSSPSKSVKSKSMDLYNVDFHSTLSNVSKSVVNKSKASLISIASLASNAESLVSKPSQSAVSKLQSVMSGSLLSQPSSELSKETPSPSEQYITSNISDIISTPVSTPISTPSPISTSTPSPSITPSITIPPSPKIEPPSILPPLLFGSNIPPGSGGGGYNKRYKKHEQLFEYGFRPDIAAVAESKMLKSGSNVIFKQKSSLPTFGLALPAIKQSPQRPTKAQQKPIAPRAAPKVLLPKFNVPMQQRPAKAPPRVVSTKFNLPTQRVPQVRAPAQKNVSMPQFAQFKMPSAGVTHKSSNTGLKSMSLPSSMPQKKKGKK